jgi:hypothetical protein
MCARRTPSNITRTATRRSRKPTGRISDRWVCHCEKLCQCPSLFSVLGRRPRAGLWTWYGGPASKNAQ